MSGDPAGKIFLIFGTDGSVSPDKLADSFSRAYPFIDTRETFLDLAQAVKAEIPADLKLKANESYTVSLPQNMIREILANANLSEAQTQIVIDGLN